MKKTPLLDMSAMVGVKVEFMLEPLKFLSLNEMISVAKNELSLESYNMINFSVNSTKNGKIIYDFIS
jgi:hypothetical protein